jgi:hypothetical protein
MRAAAAAQDEAGNLLELVCVEPGAVSAAHVDDHAG